MGKDIEFIPDEFSIDVGLDNVNVDLDGGVDLNLNVDGSMDLGLDNVNMELDMGLDDVNVCLSLGIKELPSMKVHMPMNYEFGYEVFGIKMFNFCIGGKSMLVTEGNDGPIDCNKDKYQAIANAPRTVEKDGLSITFDQ